MRKWIRSRVTAPTRLSLVAILVVASVGFVALSSTSTARSRSARTQRGVEAAKQVHCGDAITTDVTLHHNLVNCPNNGIVIGADDITFDLNGHVIDGDGTPFSGCHPQTEVCDVGVVNDVHDGVTVRQGSVRQFAGGVGTGGHHNRLLGLAASRNLFYGLGLFGSNRTVVRNSSGKGSFNREGDADGMILFDCRHARILHNSFRNNGLVGMVSGKSNHNSIKENLFSQNGSEGFLMEGGKRNRIRGNRIARNGGGITLGPGSDNVIAANRVSHAHDGIRIEKGHGNLIANNVVVHPHRAGIRLGLKQFRSSGGAHNVVRRNLVTAVSMTSWSLVRPATAS